MKLVMVLMLAALPLYCYAGELRAGKATWATADGKWNHVVIPVTGQFQYKGPAIIDLSIITTVGKELCFYGFCPCPGAVCYPVCLTIENSAVKPRMNLRNIC